MRDIVIIYFIKIEYEVIITLTIEGDELGEHRKLSELMMRGDKTYL